MDVESGRGRHKVSTQKEGTTENEYETENETEPESKSLTRVTRWKQVTCVKKRWKATGARESERC